MLKICILYLQLFTQNTVMVPAKKKDLNANLKGMTYIFKMLKWQ